MKTIRAWNCAALLAAVFILPLGGANLSAHEVGPYFTGDRILINATINGEAVRLAYDTGADFTALFGSVAERLKLKIAESRDISLGGHPAKIGQSDLVKVKMMGVETESKFTVLVSTGGGWLDGLFSWRDMRVAWVLIDGYDRNFRTSDRPPENKGAWQTWKLETETRQLFFEVTKKGETYGRVFVDTGASTGLRLGPKLWKQWREANPDAGVSLESFQYLVGDAQVDEVGWAREYRLGDLTFYDVEISRIPGDREENGESIDAKGKPYIAMIGARALRRMRLAISQKNGEIRTQSVAPVPDHNRLGAVFVPRSNTDPPFVAHVLKKGPAAEAGLKNGDILLEIDGIDFRKGRSEAGQHPQQLFNGPAGTKMTLKVEREGEAREFSVTLRDLLK